MKLVGSDFVTQLPSLADGNGGLQQLPPVGQGVSSGQRGAERMNKEQLFEEIRHELEVHTQIEETMRYPALQKREELKDRVLEAIEEHRQVKMLLRESNRLSEGSEKLDAKVKVMSEDGEHHVKEEENEMFSKVREIYSQEQFDKLGQQLTEAKQEFGQTRRRSTAG